MFPRTYLWEPPSAAVRPMVEVVLHAQVQQLKKRELIQTFVQGRSNLSTQCMKGGG